MPSLVDHRETPAVTSLDWGPTSGITRAARTREGEVLLRAALFTVGCVSLLGDGPLRNLIEEVTGKVRQTVGSVVLGLLRIASQPARSPRPAQLL